MARTLTRHIVREAFTLLAPRERVLFYGAALAATLSAIVLAVSFAITHTVRVPADGGSFTEAVVGSPRYANPVLASANDADRDLVRLTHAGLLRTRPDGSLEPDLADSYQVSTDSRTFVFTLRANLTWHDGQPLTADDVVFTYRLLQNPDYAIRVPNALRGVRIEARDERTVAMALPAPYAPFLNVATAGLMPKHLWKDVNPEAFRLNDRNLSPVGAGPYRIGEVTRSDDGTVRTIVLEAFAQYHRSRAHLDRITLAFYPTREEALEAVVEGDADGYGGATPEELSVLEDAAMDIHAFRQPEVFAVFFNTSRNTLLADRAVREALDYAVDRDAILRDAYGSKGEAVFGILPPSANGFAPETAIRAYDPARATSILEKAGWRAGENGMRAQRDTAKRPTPTVGQATPTPARTGTSVTPPAPASEIPSATSLTFTLSVPDIPQLRAAAERLRDQWRVVGVDVTLDLVDPADFSNNRIVPREYDAILFGHIVGFTPDPYVFWHSDFARDGYNLSLYRNARVDKLLEDVRAAANAADRERKLVEVQRAIYTDIPSISLVSPYYLYAASSRVHAIPAGAIQLPSDRFSGVNTWYEKTTREWRLEE